MTLSGSSEWHDHPERGCKNAEFGEFFPKLARGNSRAALNFAIEVDRLTEICFSCPVQQECLQSAIDNSEFGVWGGVHFPMRLRSSQMASFRRHLAAAQDGVRLPYAWIGPRVKISA